MIPVYIFLALTGVGYYLSNTAKHEDENIKVSKNDIANVYKQKMMKMAQKITQEKANKVVGDFHRNNNAARNTENAEPVKMVSELSGQVLENFSHNNTQPFFKGNRSNEQYHKDGFINKLEIATGMVPFYRPKEAVPTMFKPEDNVQEIAGNKVNLDSKQKYYLQSRTKNGEKPFQEQRIGPGLGEEDTIGGHGGLNAANYNRETFLGRYKDANELRVATNPKTTYDARNVDGIREQLFNTDGLGKVCKNRPELEEEHGDKRLFVTTGAFTGHENYPEYLVRDTDKENFAVEYTGIAGNKSQQKYVNGEYQFNNINQLSDFGIRNATLNDYGKGADFDYGKSNIVIYTNERSETTCKTHRTNFTTYVKALTAPLLDIMRASNKEYFVQNPRVNGIISANMPKKMTVYDPNDIARTTIKETLIHDTVKNNLTGNEKGQVYQMDDAKTTLRETLEDQYHPNIQGPDKSYVYDPEDVARTTMKETIIDDEREFGNINAREKEGLGYLTNNKEMRYTMRQEAFKEYGGIGDGEHMGGDGYKTAPTDLKKTQKAYISNNEHYGPGQDYLGKPMKQDKYRCIETSDAKEKSLIRPERMGSGVKVVGGKDKFKPTSLRNSCLSQQAPRATQNPGKVWQSIPDAPSFVNYTQCRDDNDKNAYRNVLDVKVGDIIARNPLAISITDNLH